MGLGSQRKRRKMYYVQLRAVDEKKNVNPCFLVETKEGSEMKRLPPETEISGKVYHLKTSSYEYRGNKEKTFIIILVDGEDQFKLEVNIRSTMARNIINYFLNREPKGFRETVFMRVYKKKKDNEEFAQIFVGDAMNNSWDWKYKNDEVQYLIEEYEDRETRKMKKDYRKLEEFLLAEFEALGRRVNAELQMENDAKGGFESSHEEEHAATATTSSAPPADLPPPPPTNPESSGSDDLPF